jgi:outer membrane lipoprotein-sorting protein
MSPSSPIRFAPIRLALLLTLAWPLQGCLFRAHKVERVVTGAPLKTATQQDLIDYVNHEAAKVRSMQATVDIDTSVGGARKGKITDYEEIRGYVLARKPAMLRMIGLMPVVRNTAFDMVSDGQVFKLWIPTKNRFLVGRNDQPGDDTKQSIENLRPQHIYDALLLREVDPEKEIAVLENDEEIVRDKEGHPVEQAAYHLDIARKGDRGWFLSRKIIFSRTDLLPHRQLVYDDFGNLATDARYEKYQDYDGIQFPSQIEIRRPREEYDIVLHMVKLQLNATLTDEQFALAQPPGAQIKQLGEPAVKTPGGQSQ